MDHAIGQNPAKPDAPGADAVPAARPPSFGAGKNTIALLDSTHPDAAGFPKRVGVNALARP